MNDAIERAKYYTHKYLEHPNSREGLENLAKVAEIFQNTPGLSFKWEDSVVKEVKDDKLQESLRNIPRNVIKSDKREEMLSSPENAMKLVFQNNLVIQAALAMKNDPQATKPETQDLWKRVQEEVDITKVPPNFQKQFNETMKMDQFEPPKMEPPKPKNQSKEQDVVSMGVGGRPNPSGLPLLSAAHGHEVSSNWSGVEIGGDLPGDWDTQSNGNFEDHMINVESQVNQSSFNQSVSINKEIDKVEEIVKKDTIENKFELQEQSTQESKKEERSSFDPKPKPPGVPNH